MSRSPYVREALAWANEQREQAGEPRLAAMPPGNNGSTVESSLARALPGEWNCVTRTHWMGNYSTFTTLPERVQEFQRRIESGAYSDLDER